MAWNRGLSEPLILLVGGAWFVVALAIGPSRSRTLNRAIDVDRLPNVTGSPILAAWVLAAVTVLWGFVWARAYHVNANGWSTPQVNLWGDWSFHFGDVASFAYGDNFPPRQPRLMGQPFVYHYLSSLTAACWVKLGVDERVALTTLSFILCVLTSLAVFSFARRMSGDRAAGALAVVLFLLGGGFAWVVQLRHEAAHGGLTLTGWDSGALATAGFQWPNVMWAFLEPQRSTLYGIPLALLVLTLLAEGARTRHPGLFVGAGCVAGLLPFANVGALLALVLMTPAMALLLPSRGWIAFGMAAVAVGLPQLMAMQGAGSGLAHGTTGIVHAFRWQPGWLAPGARWPWFWLENLGVLLPLAVWGLARRDLQPVPRRLLLSTFLVFALANLFVFQPWDWDNTKILLYTFLGVCVIVAAFVTRSWRSNPSVVARVAWVLVIAASLASGIKLQLHQLFGHEQFPFLTQEELALATWTRGHTDPRGRFLVGLQHNHPIPVLSGRPVVMSYAGWLWAQGTDPKPYEQDVRAMYALEPRADSLLAHYHVARVVIGPGERDQFHPDTTAWRARFRIVYRSPHYQVFAVDSTAWREGAAPRALR
jgi:hypothetical protein